MLVHYPLKAAPLAILIQYWRKDCEVKCLQSITEKMTEIKIVNVCMSWRGEGDLSRLV